MTCVRDVSRHYICERATSVRAEEPVARLKHDLSPLGSNAHGWRGRFELQYPTNQPVIKPPLRF
jgi:hypothetical protein